MLSVIMEKSIYVCVGKKKLRDLLQQAFFFQIKFFCARTYTKVRKEQINKRLGDSCRQWKTRYGTNGGDMEMWDTH